MVETTKSVILLRILLTCVFNTWYMLCLLGLLLCHHYINDEVHFQSTRQDLFIFLQLCNNK